MNHVGFFVNSDVCFDTDLTNVLDGNPGIGGTEYTTIVLATLLSNRRYSVHLYSKEPLVGINNNIIKSTASNKLEALRVFDHECGGIFIYSPISINELRFHNISRTKVINWFHLNNLEYNFCKELATSNIVAANIFLTEDQYRRYYFSPKLLKKSTIIGHFVNHVPEKQLSDERLKNNNVTFVGYVGKKKAGVDELLLAWSKVVKKVPDARLYICGGSRTYNKKEEIGIHGITEKEYEETLFSIVEKHGLNNSVTFQGNVGFIEKNELFKQTKVGIVVPTTKSLPETFCLSAVDFGSYAIPCVSGDLGGLKDTLPKKCGFRIKNKNQLSKRIIKLLINDNLNKQFGANYYHYVNNNYSQVLFLDKWIHIINLVFNDNIVKKVVLFKPVACIKCYSKFLFRVAKRLLRQGTNHI